MARAFGLPYKGSKNKIGQKLLNQIPSADIFVDLFAGGCAMSHIALLSDKYKKILTLAVFFDIIHTLKHRAGINTKKVKEHKAVKATHLNTGETLFFNSMATAERYFRAKGLPAYQGSISAVCRGRNKKHLNYKWEFADENIR